MGWGVKLLSSRPNLSPYFLFRGIPFCNDSQNGNLRNYLKTETLSDPSSAVAALRRVEAKELYAPEDYSRFSDKMQKKGFGWVSKTFK